MKFRIWLESNSDVSIPVGTILFHGSIAEFEEAKLTVGGYDEVLWLAYTPDIAQAYIPYTKPYYVSTGKLSRPAWDKRDREIQKKFGVHYDYDKIKWKNYLPDGSWEAAKRDDGTYWRGLKEKDIDDMLIKAGYKPKYEKQSNLYDRDFVIQDEDKTGRLFVLTVNEELHVFDYAGERESDLQEPDYHNTPLFRNIEKQGYDGIIIPDYAQTKTWGNMHHKSLGIFRNSIKKLKWESIQAKHTDFDKVGKDRYTPEYLDFLKRKSNER